MQNNDQWEFDISEMTISSESSSSLLSPPITTGYAVGTSLVTISNTPDTEMGFIEYFSIGGTGTGADCSSGYPSPSIVKSDSVEYDHQSPSETVAALNCDVPCDKQPALDGVSEDVKDTGDNVKSDHDHESVKCGEKNIEADSDNELVRLPAGESNSG